MFLEISLEIQIQVLITLLTEAWESKLIALLSGSYKEILQCGMFFILCSFSVTCTQAVPSLPAGKELMFREGLLYAMHLGMLV